MQFFKTYSLLEILFYYFYFLCIGKICVTPNNHMMKKLMIRGIIIKIVSQYTWWKGEFSF